MFSKIEIICLILILAGIMLFCWAAWGGELVIGNPNDFGLEAGLGLNPPIFK